MDVKSAFHNVFRVRSGDVIGDVTPDMTPEQRLAILTDPIHSIPPREVVIDRLRDPFGMLEQRDTYSVLAEELFDKCQELEAVISPTNHHKLTTFPTVTVTPHFRYGMTRSDTEAATVYTIARREQDQHGNGFSLVRNHQGSVLIKTQDSRSADVLDDETYYRLLATGKKWIQDYAIGLGLDPKIMTKPTNSLPIAEQKVVQRIGERVYYGKEISPAGRLALEAAQLKRQELDEKPNSPRKRAERKAAKRQSHVDFFRNLVGRL